MTLPLIVGISGASGAIYGVRVLQTLRKTKVPTHLIIFRSAVRTLQEEPDLTVGNVRALANATYSNKTSAPRYRAVR